MAAGSDLGAIEHIVMLMQENRSFDHYFGTLTGVRGFDDHPKDRLGVFAQSWPANTAFTPRGVLLPYRLDTKNNTDAECTYDLTHAWNAQHDCWDNGSMTKFVATHTLAENEGPVYGLLTMGYYSREDLPFYYALADAFTICDGYHCSVLGPTNPNRLYWMTGTIDPAGQSGGPVIVTSEDDSIKGSLSWTTMPEVLEDAGISWKVYNPPGTEYVPSSPLSSTVSNNVLQMFKQYIDPTSVLWEKAFLSSFPTTFTEDVKAGTLPKVSWMVAPTFPQDMTEHPPAPAARGEYYTHSVLDVLTSNPEVWSKTLLILSYDENDGFFDHVPPPTPRRGTKDEYLTASPLPAAADGIDGPIGLGFRVPSLVISPFSRGGRVVSDTMDHTSQLRLLEERFGVRIPHLSEWRRSHTGDFTTAILPGSPDTTVPSLPATPLDATSVVEECQAPELIEQNVQSPQYPIPAVQQMPTQEA
jgi:phospholipase C